MNEIEMKKLFNDFMEAEAPIQLKLLFHEICESQAIMLQECFHAFARKVMDETNSFGVKNDCSCADRHEEGIVWSGRTGRYIKCQCQKK